MKTPNHYKFFLFIKEKIRLIIFLYLFLCLIYSGCKSKKQQLVENYNNAKNCHLDSFLKKRAFQRSNLVYISHHNLSDMILVEDNNPKTVNDIKIINNDDIVKNNKVLPDTLKQYIFYIYIEFKKTKAIEIEGREQTIVFKYSNSPCLIYIKSKSQGILEYTNRVEAIKLDKDWYYFNCQKEQ